MCAVEFAVLTRENGKTVIRVLTHSEVDSLLKRHEAAEEAIKKEKEQKR